MRAPSSAPGPVGRVVVPPWVEPPSGSSSSRLACDLPGAVGERSSRQVLANVLFTLGRRNDVGRRIMCCVESSVSRVDEVGLPRSSSRRL